MKQPPKTSIERQKALNKRREESGLKLLRNLWAHPDDHPKIKAFTLGLNQARELAAAKTPTD